MNSPFGNPFYRFFMKLDAVISDGVFSLGRAIVRGAKAYADWANSLRFYGFFRVFADIADDALTFGLAIGIGLLIFALPPFQGEGDVWNQRREYAVTFSDASGHIVGRRGIRQDDNIPIREIPPVLIQAVLATEDTRFYNHFGIDLIGTLRALVENAKDSEVRQGGSSLTQQLAKNLFLSPERTLRRKINEVFLAFWIEARLSKDDILKLYLDRSYLGGGNYGVEAASQFYFGKSVRDVNLSEAAMLAGLFKAPTRYAPHANMEASRQRSRVVLGRMLDAGFITPGEMAQARREPAVIVSPAEFISPDWFLDHAYKETLAILEKQGAKSGFVVEVKTTIDPAMQTHAQEVINAALDTEAPAYKATQAALVSIAPEGALKAIVGGRSYENSQFNRATDAMRQPGSSFKPFVFLAALMNGYTPDSIVFDAPITIGAWTARNYAGKYAGRTTLTAALAHSYNTVPLHLMRAIGRKSIIDTAQNSGLQSKLLSVPSMPLGSNEVTVMDMAQGYATFASGGIPAKTYAVIEIKRTDGTVIYRRDEAPRPRAFPEEKIAELNQMMGAVIDSGTGRRALLGFESQAGKTGTTSSYRDAWFVGYTAQLVTAVWYGNDDYSEMNDMTGGTLPALTWQRFSALALQGATPSGMVGLPLDERYSQLAARTDLNLPEIPLENEVREPIVTAELPPQAAPAVVKQEVMKPSLRNFFGLFGNKPKPSVKPQTLFEKLRSSMER